MTVIAGVINLDASKALPASAPAELRHAVCRGVEREVEEVRDNAGYIAHLDVGAFGVRSSFRDESGGVTVLVGDPLIEASDGAAVSRDRAAQVLHAALARGDDTPLGRACGTFALVHYQPSRRRVVLATDKIGIRPVYYWHDEGLVVFATQFRIIEQCSLVRKVIDARAVTETVCFGHALADRTPYVGVSRLRAGEIVDFTHRSATRRRYWRWDQIPKSELHDSEIERRAYQTFERAVQIRLRGDRVTLSYLSGGLDSRCIASVLRKLGSKVVSFDFSAEGTKDTAFARMFADKSGCDHTHIPLPRPVRSERELFAYWMVEASQKAFAAGNAETPERPKIAWSGDNGSFSVGLLHLNDTMFGHARVGDHEAAIEAYLDDVSLSPNPRIFNSRIAALVECVPFAGVSEELDRIECADWQTKLYILYLTTALSHFLDRNFEDIDRHQLEFHTPFCDAKLIEVMVSAPMKDAVAHRFYHRWLALFPSFTTAVPWQTYPTHEPCFVPAPPGSAAQWEFDFPDHDDSERIKLVRRLWSALWSPRWPSALVRRPVLAVRWLAAALKIGDHRFVLSAAATYYEYATSAAGLVSFDSLRSIRRAGSLADRGGPSCAGAPSVRSEGLHQRLGVPGDAAASKAREKSTVDG